jgi:hypothetical protein
MLCQRTKETGRPVRSLDAACLCVCWGGGVKARPQRPVLLLAVRVVLRGGISAPAQGALAAKRVHDLQCCCCTVLCCAAAACWCDREGRVS